MKLRPIYRQPLKLIGHSVDFAFNIVTLIILMCYAPVGLLLAVFFEGAFSWLIFGLTITSRKITKFFGLYEE